MSPDDDKQYWLMEDYHLMPRKGPGCMVNMKAGQMIPFDKESGGYWLDMKMQPPGERRAKPVALVELRCCGRGSVEHDPLRGHSFDYFNPEDYDYENEQREHVEEDIRVQQAAMPVAP